MVGCVRPVARAAADKLPPRNTARNERTKDQSLKLPLRILIAPEEFLAIFVRRANLHCFSRSTKRSLEPRYQRLPHRQLPSFSAIPALLAGPSPRRLPQPRPERLSLIHELFRREPLFAGAAMFLAALMVPTTFALLIDQRTFQGINVWIKPLKFEFALTVYLATLAWFADWLPRGVTRSYWYRGYAAIVVFTIAAEIVWVGGAATMGVGSQFNSAVRGLYPPMGFLAIVLTTATLVYGVLIWRDTESRLDPMFLLSVGLGLFLTFVLTLIAAVTLSSLRIAFRRRMRVGCPWFFDHGLVARRRRSARCPFLRDTCHARAPLGRICGEPRCPNLGRFAVIAASVIYTTFVAYTFVEALQG